ncbi:hypothetical protein LCGC14_0709440 [marine sediment metagenome]|uniref:Uncharacterized protein n=1 Tax=marine sediment metagenome TaxID=412755 RepID=A0A0F9R0Z2_9ZZZZ
MTRSMHQAARAQPRRTAGNHVYQQYGYPTWPNVTSMRPWPRMSSIVNPVREQLRGEGLLVAWWEQQM